MDNLKISINTCLWHNFGAHQVHRPTHDPKPQAGVMDLPGPWYLQHWVMAKAMATNSPMQMISKHDTINCIISIILTNIT